MKLKKGSFTSNFLVLFSGNTLSQLIPFIFYSIIARLFTPEEMAIRANFLALAGMISIAAAGRYEMAIVLPAEKKKAMNLFALSTWLTLIISAFCIVCYFFRFQIDTLYQEGKMSEYIILLVVAVPLYTFNNVFTQWLIREKLYKAITSSAIARSLFINLFITLFGYASYGVMGLILGNIIGLTVSLVVMIIASQKSLDYSLVNRSEMIKVSKEFKDFPLINGPHAFIDLLFSQLILFAIITRFYGLDELGYFSMMSTLLLASMKAIGNAVGQLYYKEASERLANRQDVFYAFLRSIKLVSYFAIPAFLVVLVYGSELFKWYLGDDYAQSGVYAQIMIFPIFINFLVSPVSSTPLIYRKQSLAFVFSLVAYLFSIGAIFYGHYLKLDFYSTLVIYAVIQSIYYLVLMIWYMKLTRT